MKCNAEQMSSLLKSKKKVMVIIGAQSERVMFPDGRSLLDYAQRVSDSLGASVGATGNTLRPLKEKSVNINGSKQWLIEIINQVSSPFPGPFLESRPDLILFIGYPARVLNNFLPSVESIDTAYLGIRYIPSATASPPDMSLEEMQRYLEQLLLAVLEINPT